LPVIIDGKLVGVVKSMVLVREHQKIIGLLEDICGPQTTS
jgi:hypothetical protein